MTERPLDLGALGPWDGDEGHEALIRAINERAAPELARRAAARGPFLVLSGWARPAFAAAAALAAVSFLGIAAARSGGGAQPTVSVAEELGLPAPVAEWISEDRAPTRDDLILAMESDL